MFFGRQNCWCHYEKMCDGTQECQWVRKQKLTITTATGVIDNYNKKI